jgi:hypothetical protein
VTAVCGRTCAWFSSLADKEFYMQQNDIFAARLNAGVIDPNNPFSYSPDAQYAFVLSRAENAQFEQYCATGNSDRVGGRMGSPVCGCLAASEAEQSHAAGSQLLVDQACMQTDPTRNYFDIF